MVKTHPCDLQYQKGWSSSGGCSRTLPAYDNKSVICHDGRSNLFMMLLAWQVSTSNPASTTYVWAKCIPCLRPCIRLMVQTPGQLAQGHIYNIYRPRVSKQPGAYSKCSDCETCGLLNHCKHKLIEEGTRKCVRIVINMDQRN